MAAFLLSHFQPPLHGVGHQIGGFVVCPVADVGDGDQGVVAVEPFPRIVEPVVGQVYDDELLRII